MSASSTSRCEEASMRKLNRDAKRVLICAMILAAFALGLVLGAKVEAGIQKTLAVEARR